MKPSEFIKEYIDRLDTDSNPTDTITVDVPLFIRLLEYAREDAQTDMDLHELTERITKLAANNETLTMDDYDSICPSEQPVAEDASGGGTSSGGVATSMGGGAGFGKSIFMSRTGPKTKKSRK